ncbi:MAG: ATP-dependent helicase RecG [Pseudobdellovibrio sp.]|nr:ATP-dependent helicase RecG [Pseudobdellovibrio sp.]
MALRLDSEAQYIKGVGPKLGGMFARNGIRTVLDLFQNYPRAYEDRRAARNIASLKPEDVVSLKAKVISVSSYNMGRSSRKIYDVLIRDAIFSRSVQRLLRTISKRKRSARCR